MCKRCSWEHKRQKQFFKRCSERSKI